MMKKGFLIFYSSLFTLHSLPLWAVEEAPPSDMRQSYLHYILGSRFRLKGDAASAISEYEKSLSLDPTAVFLHGELAALYANFGNLDRAVAETHLLLKSDPNNIGALTLLASIHIARQEAAPAVAVLEKVVRLDPGRWEAVLSLSVLLADLSRREEALTTLKAFVQKQPKHLQAHLQLGLFLERFGRREEAQKAFEKVLALDPEALTARIALGQIAEDGNDPDEALRQYQKALEADPENLLLLNHIGEVFWRRKRNPQRAQEIFGRVMEISPDNPTALSYSAEIAEAVKDYPLAIQSLEKLSRLKIYPEVSLHLGYLYSMIGELRQATQALERAVKEIPHRPEAWFFLGLAYQDQKKLSRAAMSFERALSVKPDYVEAAFQRGVVLERMGKIEEAVASFWRVIELDPKNAASYNYIGYTWADRNLHLEKALPLIEKALALDPANGAYLDSLGWVYYRMGQTEKARGYLETASRKMEDPIILEHFGDVLWALGEKEKALLSWKASGDMESTPALRRKIESARGRVHLGAPQIMESIRGGILSLKDISGFATVTLRQGRRLESFRAAFYYKRPRRIRLEILGAIGAPAATLFVEDKKVKMRLADGTLAAEEQPAWIFPLLSLLEGDALPTAGVAKEGKAAILRGQDLTAHLDLRRERIERLFSRAGSSATEIRFSGERFFGRAGWPQRLEVVNTSEGLHVLLEFEKLRKNQNLADSLFAP